MIGLDPNVVLAAPIVLVVAVALARRAQSPQLDPQRLFDADQKRIGRARCGSRCEHKSPFWKRCAGEADEADHVYPWSKGGATSLGNLQYLCRAHNRRKSAWRPTSAYIWRLERRRLRYFPENEPVKVVWKLGAVPPPRGPVPAKTCSPTGRTVSRHPTDPGQAVRRT